MIYVMSDIHGYYGKFSNMLKNISFSNNDTLYILGDVIDRGPYGIKILQEIIQTPNIHLLMGNHEHMFLAWLEKMDYYSKPYKEDSMLFLWFKNGGESTHSAFQNLSEKEQNEIHQFLKTLPYELTVRLGNHNFRMVHGYPANKDDFMREGKLLETAYNDVLIWERPFKNCPPTVRDNETILLGHTPVAFYDKKEPFEVLEIFHNVFNIDCGMATNKRKARRLACMCLDTMNVFYS